MATRSGNTLRRATTKAAAPVMILGLAAGTAWATDLNPAHVGASSSDTTSWPTNQCSQAELDYIADNPDSVVWHFVLTSTTAVNTGTLTTNFTTAGPKSTLYYKFVGGVLHWDVATARQDVLEAASTDAVGNNLNLSHICGGGDELPPYVTIGGGKYYDANANGAWDESEPFLPNAPAPGTVFKAILTYPYPAPADVIPTVEYFDMPWTATLATGTPYQVCEVAVAYPWLATGPLPGAESGTLGSDAVAALNGTQSKVCWVGTAGTATPDDEDALDFGNVCLGSGGGLTLGFWSNKNGQKLVGDDDLAAMRTLNLRNASGAEFDPASYASFRSWLLSASATNMAYMLSAQLAAMKLNVDNGKVAGDALVYAGAAPYASCAVASPTGFVGVNDLIATADSALGTNGSTTAGGVARECQRYLKDALDNANNNANFAQASLATCTAQVPAFVEPVPTATNP